MKEWKILSEYEKGDNVVEKILKNRGFKSDSDINKFLNPGSINGYFDGMPDDFKKSLKKAKELVEIAIRKESPIVIHGDYDADGISATAVLYNTIKKELGYGNVFYFIPSRFDHGYGLSKNSLDGILKIPELQSKKRVIDPLLITVDCGITAEAEIGYAKELGFKVIITDHHQKPEKLPGADCIVWSDAAVGTAVAWFLSRVLGSKDARNIALVALATVTDLQPVTGINRIFVKKGLEVINTNPLPGLRKLAELSGKIGSEITAYDLGWVLGPRINASGRLQQAQDSLKLFVLDDENEIADVAKSLNEVNTMRQDKTMEMLEIASFKDESDPGKLIVSVDENYHEGIIGLVAARLVQKYYRPSIVIALSGEVGKGSVRSISGIDIISALRNFEDLFLNLGGHPMAAGFSIEKAKIEQLKLKMTEFIDKNYSQEFFTRVMTIDMKIPADLIGLELLENVEKMKPFGLGNEEPVFCVTAIGVFSAAKVGSDSQHLILKLFNGGKYYKAVYFNESTLADELQLGDKTDLAFTLKRNEYNGRLYVDMVVKDVKMRGKS